mgnify:CR=1 FL=1
MLYDMKADAYSIMNRADQEHRTRELARQRLASEARAGRQARYTNPIPGLVDWVRELAKRKPGITPKPVS